MSGKDLRDKMIERAESYDVRPLQAHEKTLLNFVATYVPDESHQKLLFSILIDSIFRIFFISAATRFQTEASVRSEAISDFLKQNTFLPDEDVFRIQQLLKGALSDKFAGRVKNERKKRIREKASENCYLCGLSIDEDDETEIDHVWPHSLGGKNSKKNLKLAHAECAAVKADAATLSDVLIGGIAYISAPSGLKNSAHDLKFWPYQISDKDDFNGYRRNVVSSNLRLAVFMKQDFKCFRCQSDFADVGEATVVSPDDESEWSVLNMNAYCEECRPR